MLIKVGDEDIHELYGGRNYYISLSYRVFQDPDGKVEFDIDDLMIWDDNEKDVTNDMEEVLAPILTDRVWDMIEDSLWEN